jgi:hypothetical protein
LASGDSGLDREIVLWASFFFSGESCVGQILSKRLEVETRENGVGGSESQGVSVGGFPADHHNHGHRTASGQLQAAEEGSQRGHQDVEQRDSGVRGDGSRHGAVGDFAALAVASGGQERAIRVRAVQASVRTGLWGFKARHRVFRNYQRGQPIEVANPATEGRHREAAHLMKGLERKGRRGDRTAPEREKETTPDRDWSVYDVYGDGEVARMAN